MSNRLIPPEMLQSCSLMSALQSSRLGLSDGPPVALRILSRTVESTSGGYLATSLASPRRVRPPAMFAYLAYTESRSWLHSPAPSSEAPLVV